MRVVSAARSEEQQRQAAGGLQRAGLRAGDRVGVLAYPTAEVLAVVLGALRTGIVPVMLDPASPPGERAELCADADPALVVTEAAALLNAPPADLAPVPLARPMHYTSGTTGRRKGVWSGVLDEEAARSLFVEEVELWGFEPGDRHLVLSPLHHSAPLRFAANTLLAGGSVGLAGPFDAARTLEAMAGFRPTTTFCVPTQLKRLTAAADAAGGFPPVRHFRLLAHAGEPCPPRLKQRVVDEFPADSVYEFYGATEAQFTVCSTAQWRERPGSVGRARPGRKLRIGDGGVIWCRLPRHARFTYWRDPEKTSAAWHGAELTVGDLGRLDADGYLYLNGRRGDLVITGGVNVYPGEVERVLAQCDGVDEVAVFGVPDERWGQRLCAAVVGPATAEVLADFARHHLSPAKRPKEYHPVPRLPTTSTGKLRRLDLPGMLGLG